jgi:hypothetical protein
MQRRARRQAGRHVRLGSQAGIKFSAERKGREGRAEQARRQVGLNNLAGRRM